MKMVKLTKTLRCHTQKFVFSQTKFQIDDVFIVGSAILEWPVLILSHGAHVDDMGLSQADFLILFPPFLIIKNNFNS